MVRLVSWVRFPQRARPETSRTWRRSSVGQSIRLIIGRSSVRSRSPLPDPTQQSSHPERRHSKHHEQGEVRAHQAAREHRHDGSHRPWQDDVDGGDLEDAGGARGWREYTPFDQIDKAPEEKARGITISIAHIEYETREAALRARRHAGSRRLHQEHDHRCGAGRRGDPGGGGDGWSDAADPWSTCCWPARSACRTSSWR